MDRAPNEGVPPLSSVSFSTFFSLLSFFRALQVCLFFLQFHNLPLSNSPHLNMVAIKTESPQGSRESTPKVKKEDSPAKASPSNVDYSKYRIIERGINSQVRTFPSLHTNTTSLTSPGQSLGHSRVHAPRRLASLWLSLLQSRPKLFLPAP